MKREAAGPELFRPAVVHREDRADGSVVLRSGYRLGSYPASMVEVFAVRAREHPERLLVAQRDGDGWRRVSWGEAAARVEAVAGGLVERGVAGRPVMILSGNSVEHLLLTLAAFRVGSPAVPVSAAYSLQSSDHEKLRTMAALVCPGLVFAEDTGAFGPALAAVRQACAVLEPPGEPVMVTVAGGAGTVTWPDLAAAVPGPGGGLPHSGAGPDTVAKLLFTSGSTGEPKAVITTQRMLCANQQAMLQVWPFLAGQPPLLLDWLPWSHTFGGSHNVGMVLYNGGSLYIDDGRPAPGLIEKTLRNLGDAAPTVFFNVPVGYALLVPRLKADPALAKLFYRGLRVVFFAAAALPQQVWEELLQLAEVAADHPVAVTTSWGTTETAPAATSAHFPSGRSDCIGVPLPGVEIKLVPEGSKREIRVRGPNVTPGYYARPDLTAAAFDDEGYYRTGDAAELIDPAQPERGLRFAGRIAEDFKLATGTWVNVAAVKSALLSACGGVLQDCVIAGHDRGYIAALAWVNPTAAAQAAGGSHPADSQGPALPDDPGLRAYLAESLAALNQATGTSRRVERLMLLSDPPDLDAGEITDKGYINQRACLTRRAADVAALYSPASHPRIVLPASSHPTPTASADQQA
jgi:feruloyl-CoA synthase